MTLCIAWKEDGEIHLASDSRYSFGDREEVADVAVKVMSLPVRVFGPSGAGGMATVYGGEIGIGVVGSFVSTYTAKECVGEVLRNLQAAPGYTEVSLPAMVRVILRFFDSISRGVGRAMADKGLGQLIITGYCPQRQKPRCFSLTPAKGGGRLTFEMREELVRRQFTLFGSGKRHVQDGPQRAHSMTILRLLKSVINNPSAKTVGGAIQYGHTRKQEFRLKGIWDYIVDSQEKVVKLGLYVGGTVLRDGTITDESQGLNFAYTFICPFDAEIESLRKRGYRVQEAWDRE